MGYQKYVYWLDFDEAPRLRGVLKRQGMVPTDIKKAVCLPLSRQIDIGWVGPEVWQSFALCRRQLSWYRHSPLHGKTLLVSSTELTEKFPPPAAILQNSNFRPGGLPKKQDWPTLIKRESYLKARPKEWEDLRAEDQEQQKRWLAVMGLGGTSFEELFVGHCANHANFIEPRYYALEDGQPVPYSLGRTVTVCSACLEFFNVIGGSFRKKYVVPCPGAVLFAGMVPDHYYEVISP
jgi:hypothetical protein